MNGRKNLLLWLTVAAIWGLVVYVVLAHPMPLVSRTWPDGACVRVEPAPLSCDALPRRYVTKWVGSDDGAMNTEPYRTQGRASTRPLSPPRR